MKKIIYLSFLTCPLIFAESTPIITKTILNKPSGHIAHTNKKHPLPAPRLINKIVASVNNQVITKHELDNQVQQIKTSLAQQNITNFANKEIESQALNKLILDKIQLERAKQLGITVTENEVNSRIETMAKNENISLEDFEKRISSQGIDSIDLKKQIHTQLVIERLSQREVAARVVITEDQVNSVYSSKTYKNNTDYNLSIINIAIPENATKEIIQEKAAIANEVINQLNKGVSFPRLAAEYSTDNNALSSGILSKVVKNTELEQPILEQIQKLGKGQHTAIPIKTPYAFIIIKVNDIIPRGAPKNIVQYNVRHILIKTNELISDQEAQQKIRQISAKLTALKSNPDKESQEFQLLAKEYSQDTSSIKGGDLGWLSSGETVPQFESMIKSTPVGKISAPFKTPFGWHILQVIATRNSNAVTDLEKQEIRKDLYNARAQTIYEDWLRNLRKSATVKIYQ